MIDRIKRLETLFLEEINTHVTRLSAAGELGGFVTITAVHVSKDLSSAKVYFSVFGSPEDKKKTQEALSVCVRNRRAYAPPPALKTDSFLHL